MPSSHWPIPRSYERSWFSHPRTGVQLLMAFGIIGALLHAPTLLAQQPPSPVRVDAVTEEEVQERRSVTGEVRARRSSRVATREQGIVSAIPVSEGMTVDKGALLVQLDAKRLNLGLDEARLQVLLSQALVDEEAALLASAERDLATLETLASRGATNPKELDDARSAVATANARVRQAQQRHDIDKKQVELLQTRVADTRIIAPFAGTVLSRSVELGEWVAEGAAVVELASVNDLEIWLSVPERLLQSVTTAGAVVDLRVPAAQQEFRSDSYRVVPRMVAGSRQFAMIVAANNLTGLAPGMSAAGSVPARSRARHLTLHRDAVLRGQTGPYVFAVVEQQPGSWVASLTPIEILFSHEERVVVRGALRPGAEVVIEGNERLYPMAPIAPLPGATTPPDQSKSADSGDTGETGGK